MYLEVRELMKTKIAAIMGGGDWYDASVTHLVIPEDLDLLKWKVRYEEWYQRRDPAKEPWESFDTWLVKNNPDVRKASGGDVLEFWE